MKVRCALYFLLSYHTFLRFIRFGQFSRNILHSRLPTYFISTPRYTLVHKDDKCTCLSIFIILRFVQQHITSLHLLTRAIVCFFMVSQESARSIFAPSSVFPNKIKELLSLKFSLCLLNNFIG